MKRELKTSQTKAQTNIRDTSTSFTSFESAQMSHIPVILRVYNLNLCQKPTINGAKIKEVNDNIEMYHCILVMAQQNAEKWHFVDIVFWTRLKSRINIISQS